MVHNPGGHWHPVRGPRAPSYNPFFNKWVTSTIIRNHEIEIHATYTGCVLTQTQPSTSDKNIFDLLAG